MTNAIKVLLKMQSGFLQLASTLYVPSLLFYTPWLYQRRRRIGALTANLKLRANKNLLFSFFAMLYIKNRIT
jgi:hypothetical protein